MVLGKLDIYMQKNETKLHLYYTQKSAQNEFKVWLYDQKP